MLRFLMLLLAQQNRSSTVQLQLHFRNWITRQTGIISTTVYGITSLLSFFVRLCVPCSVRFAHHHRHTEAVGRQPSLKLIPPNYV